MTKQVIIQNNSNTIVTVKHDGDTIIFEVNDKLDYKTGGIVENPKEIKFKPDGVVNEITFNKRELELAESLYQTTPPLNTKNYEGEIFDEPTSNPLELIKDYAIKEYCSVDEVKKILREKDIDIEITEDLVNKIKLDYGVREFKAKGIIDKDRLVKLNQDGTVSQIGYKWEKYRKKEIDKNRRLRKELKKARKKIAEYKKAIEHVLKPDNNRIPYKFIINDNLHFLLFNSHVMVFNGFNLVYFSNRFINNFIETNYDIKNHPSKKICFEFEGKSDHKLKELIELNPNYKVEFV